MACGILKLFGQTHMTRPTLSASELEIIAFTRDWVRYAAKHGLDEALRLIDHRDRDPAWSEAFVRSISEDHFGDGKTCIITDPMPSRSCVLMPIAMTTVQDSLSITT